jgi:hypothetical protein
VSAAIVVTRTFGLPFLSSSPPCAMGSGDTAGAHAHFLNLSIDLEHGARLTMGLR